MERFAEVSLTGTEWDAVTRRWMNVFSNGKRLPVIAGGSDVPPPSDPPVNDDTPPPNPTTSKTVTSEEMARIAAREKEEGRRAAQRELAEQLGVSVEEAKQIISNHRTAEEQNKTEAQREKEAAAAERAAAAQEKAAAAEERHRARIERSIMLAGVTDEKRIERISRLLDVEVGADPDAVSSAVATLKEEMPEIFGSTADGEAPKPPAGVPGGKPPKPQVKDDAFTRGRERAKQASSASHYSILEANKP